ncbi:pur operon repressor, partial [Enterococcus faecium]|nr:pur operon repressor [Enterococcus faecium]
QDYTSLLYGKDVYTQKKNITGGPGNYLSE